MEQSLDGNSRRVADALSGIAAAIARPHACDGAGATCREIDARGSAGL